MTDKKIVALDLLNGDDILSTGVWWTLAPYLHNFFRAQKISAEDSIRMLIEWANSAEREDVSFFHLPGIPKDLPGQIGMLEPQQVPKERQVGHSFAEHFATKFGRQFIEVFGKKRK